MTDRTDDADLRRRGWKPRGLDLHQVIAHVVAQRPDAPAKAIARVVGCTPRVALAHMSGRCNCPL